MTIREQVISLHVGQGGCLLGDKCWEMFCLEHGIAPDGVMTAKYKWSHPESFFKTTEKGTFVPRAAFIDLDPSIIESIQVGKYKDLYDPQLLVTNKEDAGDCFARGYITQAKFVMEPIFEKIATLANDCDKLQTFLVYRAHGGGTGSGLGCQILQELHDEYPKVKVFELPLLSTSKRSSIILEPYNECLGIHASLLDTTGSFSIENEACYYIHDGLIGVPPPSFSSINDIISYAVSNITTSLRFDGILNVDFNELTTNLIPFPRLQYPIMSYAPYLSQQEISHTVLTATSILSECFRPSSQLVRCNITAGKFITCTILFRGNVTNFSAVEAIISLKNNRRFKFVDWCPNAFKIGINDVPPVAISNGHIATDDKSCIVLINNTAIKSVWMKIKHNFDLMYSKKAFLHWYLMEGMEENDFTEARTSLADLCEEYYKIEEQG